MASRFVFMEHTFISDAIQNFSAFTENGLCRSFITASTAFNTFSPQCEKQYANLRCVHDFSKIDEHVCVLVRY